MRPRATWWPAIDIGTDVTGLLALGNGSGSNPAGDGVDLIGVNSIDNTIGGSVAAAGNLISGNAYDGIYLDHASNDTLEFNLVGADAAKNFTNTSMGNADLWHRARRCRQDHDCQEPRRQQPRQVASPCSIPKPLTI